MGTGGKRGSKVEPAMRVHERRQIMAEGLTEEQRVAREFRWLNRGIILVLTIAFTIYVMYTVNEYRQDKEQPGTTVSVDQASSLAYPTFTFCNINDYDFAVLVAFLGQGNDVPQPIEQTVHFEEAIFRATGMYCYTTNSAPRDDFPPPPPGSASPPFVASAASTDYALEIVFLLNTSLASNNILFYGIGVMPYLFGTKPTENDVDRMTNFGSPGLSTVMTIKREIFESINNAQSVSYSISQSTIALAQDSPQLASIPPGFSVVHILLQYDSLNTVVTKETYAYPMTSLLGELAGMAGTILGLDCLSGILLVQLCGFKMIQRRRNATQQKLNELDFAEP